ncbi:MAG: helix-turn-helix domain-containing protein, partial [Rickettsiales bacterium]|nr:helix-turn-helix domain-containing protein [Rickettsiales bacterium]
TDSADCTIGKRIQYWRLKRKYAQEDLANKIGVPTQQILRYEQGVDNIYPHELYAIAEELSINVEALLPEDEHSCLDKDRIKALQNLVKKHKKIKNHGLHEAFYLLARSTHVNEESTIKATKVELARGLVKAGVSVDIISQATGLSTGEYNNTEKEICTDSADCTIGQRIKYWRLKRGYTQKDLANKVGVSQQQIQGYEKGENDIPRENLHALARELTVEIIALQPGPEKGENEDGEAGILSLMEECNKINNQELLNILDLLACFLCESMQACKKEVIKAVKVEVAQNLLRLGVSIDIISQITGLSADEIA